MLDLIYKRTRLLRDAEAAGATVLDGELMLLHQGAAAFTLWTGQPAPLDVMQQKLQEARAGGAALGRGRAGRRRAGDDRRRDRRPRAATPHRRRRRADRGRHAD